MEENRDRGPRVADGRGMIIPAGGPNSLAVFDSVDAIVRAHYVEGLKAMLDGPRTVEGRDAAMKEVDAIASRFQDIFFGRVPEYEAMDWNSVDDLGRALAVVLGMAPGDADDSVKTLYLAGLNEIIDATQQNARGEINDHSAQATVNWWVDYTTRLLLGLPPAD